MSRACQWAYRRLKYTYDYKISQVSRRKNAWCCAYTQRGCVYYYSQRACHHSHHLHRRPLTGVGVYIFHNACITLHVVFCLTTTHCLRYVQSFREERFFSCQYDMARGYDMDCCSSLRRMSSSRRAVMMSCMLPLKILSTPLQLFLMR